MSWGISIFGASCLWCISKFDCSLHHDVLLDDLDSLGGGGGGGGRQGIFVIFVILGPLADEVHLVVGQPLKGGLGVSGAASTVGVQVRLLRPCQHLGHHLVHRLVGHLLGGQADELQGVAEALSRVFPTVLGLQLGVGVVGRCECVRGGEVRDAAVKLLAGRTEPMEDREQPGLFIPVELERRDLGLLLERREHVVPRPQRILVLFLHALAACSAVGWGRGSIAVDVIREHLEQDGAFLPWAYGLGHVLTDEISHADEVVGKVVFQALVQLARVNVRFLRSIREILSEECVIYLLLHLGVFGVLELACVRVEHCVVAEFILALFGDFALCP